MAESQNQLAVLVQESGLDAAKGQVLSSRFADYFTIAQQWKKEAEQLVVTDEGQVELMKRARQGRLVLKDKRVQIEKTRKELKEESLKEGRAIDAVAKMLTALIEPTERFLQEQETYAERMEQQRQQENQKLIHARRALLQGYGQDSTDDALIALTNDEFSEFLNKSRVEFEQKQAAREVELQKQREADQRGRDELLKENQRLQEEQRQKDEAAAREKRQLEAELQKQRDETQRERDAERKRQQEQEQQAQAQRLLMQAQAQEKEASRTDGERLLAFADAIDNVKGTALLCSTEQGQQVVANVGQLLTRAAGFLREQAQQVHNEAA